MQGRNKFTKAEADHIRKLLRDKENATSYGQRALRRRLRSRGLYISDFGTFEGGFGLEDFERLIRLGRITMVNTSLEIPSSSRTVARSMAPDSDLTSYEETVLHPEYTHMTITECQGVVRAFLRQHLPGASHYIDRSLSSGGKSYPIRPDDTYLLPNLVIAIEYEDTKRPVESITKYWWLLMSTDWLDNGVKLKCVIFPLRTDFVRSRIEVIPILGDELAARFPDAFQFRVLMPTQLTPESIGLTLQSIL